jgi:plastin-1
VVEPGTVDERALNLKPNISKFQLIENNNLAINAAKAIGCHLVNIGAANLMAGTEHLVLGVAWQIIRKTLLVNISLKNHPELFRLLEDGETLEDLARIPPEKVLLRCVGGCGCVSARASGHVI